jgi:hypothetical protein
LLKTEFPRIAVLTHEFSKRLPNGLPEADYNDGLMEMDLEIQGLFQSAKIGLPVLVETFGGKRKYYFYVSETANVVGCFSAVAARYQCEKLSWTTHKDPDWNFFQNYSKNYLQP